jgi:nucleotide-binding universal stress UspA family protein
MRTILLPTDFSSRAGKALKFAIEIAKKTNARIIVANAYQIPVFDFKVSPYMIEDVCEDERNISEQQLQKICDNISRFKTENGKPLHCKFVSEFNSPLTEISKLIKAESPDLIIMGTEAGNKDLFSFGSTTMDVLDRFEVPVLVVKENTPINTFGKIYCAVENLQEDISALTQVIPLARSFNSEITILHAERYPESIPELDSLKDILSDKQAITRKIRARFGYSKIGFGFTVGDDTFEKLTQKLTNSRNDLLVLQKHQREWPESLFHKSVIKSLIHKSELPLLILHKPIK